MKIHTSFMSCSVTGSSFGAEAGVGLTGCGAGCGAGCGTPIPGGAPGAGAGAGAGAGLLPGLIGCAPGFAPGFAGLFGCTTTLGLFHPSFGGVTVPGNLFGPTGSPLSFW